MLISNRLTYTLVFSDEEFESDTDCNDAIFRLLELCRSNNVKWTDTLPVSKEPPFTYTTPTDEGAFRKYLESEDLPAITVGTLRPTQEAPLFMAQLRKLYGVADRLPTPHRSEGMDEITSVFLPLTIVSTMLCLLV